MILQRYNTENKELITPTLCPLPWFTEYYESDGRKAMCCKATSFVEGDVAWNGPEVRQVRKEMLQGKKPKSCTMCYSEEESAKGLSFRQEWVNMVAQRNPDFDKEIMTHTDEDGRYDGAPSVQQITLGNICTNQCNMCSPWNSSALNKVFKKVHTNLNLPYDEKWFDPEKYKWVMDDQYWVEKMYPKLHYTDALALSGGEPLIIDRFEKILEYCADNNLARDIELHFHTNTAQLPSEHTQVLLKEFKHVLINASIDDIGKRNEYIRYPTSWEQTQKFIDWGESTGDNIDLDVYVTVQNMNINYLPEIQDYWFSRDLKKFNKNFGGFIHTYLCHFPERLSSRILPIEQKKAIKDKINDWLDSLNYVCPSNDPIVIENSEWALKRFEYIISDMEIETPLMSSTSKPNSEWFNDRQQWIAAEGGLRGTLNNNESC